MRNEGYRMRNAATSSTGATSSTAASRSLPILIRFSSRSVCNFVLHNRKQLKGKSITITKQLTVFKAGLLRKCNELVKNKNASQTWSLDGKVKMKLLDGTVKDINSLDDLNGI